MLDRLRIVASRIRGLFTIRGLDRDFEQELESHLAMLTDEYIRGGMSPEEARRAARLRLGNPVTLRESHHDLRTLPFLESVIADIRFAFRMLRKNPGFTAVAILTLALGIGANTAMFSVVNAVLFRALPYRNARALVWATNFVPSQGQNLVFQDEYAGWRTQNHVFENIGAYSRPVEYTLTGADSPERLQVIQVTASFLDVLGVTPQLGHNFLPVEDRPGGPKAALLSNALWRSNFGGDFTVVGRAIALDDVPYIVVGVLPPDFEFLDNSAADVLVPFQLADSSIQISNGLVMGRIIPLSVVARLRPGATVAGAVAQLDAIVGRVLSGLPGNMRRLFGERQAQVFLLHDHEIGNVRWGLLVLLGAVGFVLLIACANVANLQLARAAGRKKELAIRGALGAGRWRLARLLLTESFAIALAGGAAGLVLAFWVIRLIRRFAPGDIPHLQTAGLDLRVLSFTLGVSLLTGILFGLAPVLAAFHVSLNDTLKEDGMRSGAGATALRVQRALVVTEIALSFVLFVGAGLLVRSFQCLTGIQPGFDPHGVLMARVALPLDQYQSPDQQGAFFEQLVEKLEALPGVVSAGATASIPLRGNTMTSGIQIEGEPPANFSVPDPPSTRINSVTPGYFAALRVPLIEGRLLDERDGATAPSSVVVNQAFVRRYLQKEDPVGRRFTTGLGVTTGTGGKRPQPQTWTIVGVIGDTKQRGLTSDITPEITASVLQWPRLMMTLVLRTSVDPSSMVSALRTQVRDVDKNLPVFGVQTMDDVLSAEIASQRFNAGALAGFAGLAVLLAAVGIYGVMTYAVSQRTHEIGIRVALGAQKRDILRMTIGHGVQLAIAGLAIGSLGGFILTHVLSSFSHLLYGVGAGDPLTFACVAALLMTVALLACYIPARRAMRVDPVVALRHE